MGAFTFAVILLLLFSLPLLVFGMELTTGSNFAMFYIFKNLNRFADASQNGAAPFDKMGYPYYPSVESNYPKMLSNLSNHKSTVEPIPEPDPESSVTIYAAMLIGEKGSCAGYTFDLASGETFIVGKDAKVSNIVIDPAYKEISRKHLSVRYDANIEQYVVTDYSSNGTWANGLKLTTGQETYLSHGTELKLANEKNIFRWG